MHVYYILLVNYNKSIITSNQNKANVTKTNNILNSTDSQLIPNLASPNNEINLILNLLLLNGLEVCPLGELL